jgi:hypothetical protein
MTKKEITKRLLKDETCIHCKYNNRGVCTKDEKNNIDIPKEQTCEQFERGQWARKLKVTWSQQAYQDLKAWQGIDVEEELIKAVSEEMKNEIDKVIENDQKRTNKLTKR